MGKIKPKRLVKLIVGFIFKELSALNAARRILEEHFGNIDFESEILAFDYTDYYEKELGKGLNRRFISFKKLLHPETLPEIKIATNRIEKKLSVVLKRKINIDPGFLDLAKLILATTKDYKHRIYLKRGIFAEVTLFYEGKSFRAWEWTYPDYRTEKYLEIFNKIREIYAEQLAKK
jgi:hypothetical protein